MEPLHALKVTDTEISERLNSAVKAEQAPENRGRLDAEPLCLVGNEIHPDADEAQRPECKASYEGKWTQQVRRKIHCRLRTVPTRHFRQIACQSRVDSKVNDRA